ncbi:sodium-coupled monocarboxylate transporter 2-like [Drosophila guanche]|uniref:Blast:Sodium-coupled monocarboxylate transporter 2 n=1 Tax=Drosophila guanche TaxID=7266 RepID=A0A3B0K3W0_DROGU|nr:sodium-coupled monocarboxylate transporter 2-like [Drosophila guanche]SPP82650.1 blast:Sodium-coupled monocarboxylate transporter 2 [Drosophila guanche]
MSSATADLRFGITDFVVFTIMLSASAGIGVYFGFFSKAKNTTEEYLRGGKKMQTLPIAISLVASQLSGIAIMSIPAESYSFGFNYIFVVLAMVAVVPILIYIIVPVFYENNVSNCYEYLEMRFNKRTRQLVTMAFVLNSFLMLPVYMFIPSLAFSQVTGMNIHLINIMVSSICIFYTMLGGIKAVVWTDVVQGGIMLLSVITVGVLGTLRSGGLSTVLEKATEGGRMDLDFRLDPRIRLTFWSAMTGGIFMWTGHIGFNQSCVQRIVSLPSYSHAKRSLIIASVGFILIMSFNTFAGIIMFARYYGCDPIVAGLVSKPDKMMPFFVQDIMGHLAGMPGVFISCVFSAALSSLSATLNSLAGVVYFDYIKPHIRHTDARANGIMKLVIIAMGGYCILGGFIVQNFNSILQTVVTITGVNTGAVVGVFLLGMFVPRCNSKVAVSSILISVVAMVWIIINGQMNFKAGLIKYQVLPNSLDQCEAQGFHMILDAINQTAISPVTPKHSGPPAPVTTAFESNRDFSLYDISFYWYKVVGALIVFVWAVPMSYVWPHDRHEKQNPKLYSPFVRKFLNLSDSEHEMEEVPLRKTTVKEIPELRVDAKEKDKEVGLEH